MNETEIKKEIEESLIDNWFKTHESLSKNEYLIMADVYAFVVANIKKRQVITQPKTELTETKICSKCNQTKTVDQFHKSTRGLSGYHSYCKECHSIYSKELLQKKKQKLALKKTRQQMKETRQNNYKNHYVEQIKQEGMENIQHE